MLFRSDEGCLHTLAGINQIMMNGAYCEQRWDGSMGFIHATVAQDDVVVAIIHALGCLLAEFIQSIMAAQLGEKDLAVAMYKRTARYDLDNINQDSQDGLHITSMSGSWLAIAKGFAGMRTLGGLRFKPFLPDCWNGYSYKFNYRGRIIELRVKPKGVTLTLISGEPISVTIYGHPYELEDVLTVPLEG